MIKQLLNSVLYRIAKIVTVEYFIVYARRENEPSFKVSFSRSLERILILVFLWFKATNSRGITGDCPLAAPNDFIRGISTGKLDSFRLDFVSVSDERGSTSRQKESSLQTVTVSL